MILFWGSKRQPTHLPYRPNLVVQTRLSSSCNDLLRKLLARDKLTVAEIMKQPWFLVDFPKGLKEMNSYCLKMKVRTLPWQPCLTPGTAG